MLVGFARLGFAAHRASRRTATARGSRPVLQSCDARRERRGVCCISSTL